ncbi:MAG TPA: hypothetical protein PKH77_26050, partial [Anaerolineae bacterium]|nr:hypothetical protein [Anaerolineae bacterium]
MRTFSRHWYRVLMLAALFATFWPAGTGATAFAPILYNAVARSSAAMNKDAVENAVGLYGAGQMVVVGAAGFSAGNETALRQDFRGRFYAGSWGSDVMDGAATTTRYFPQAPAASYLLTGTVTDANTGWALYASLEIEPDGYPPFTVWTDPWTGVYSVTLTGNSTHTLTVAPWEGVPGYVGQSRQVNLSADTYNENFALLVDSVACNAPGYQLAPPLFTETFDSVTAPAIPAEWAVVDVNGTDGNWATRTSTVNPAGQPPHSSPNLAYFNSAIVEWGHSTRLQRTSGVNLSAVSAAQVTLWVYHYSTIFSNDDRVQVQVSIDSGTTWNNVGSAISRHDGSTGWKQHTVALSTYTGAGMTDVRVGFLGIGAGGYNIHIDDIQVVSLACNVPTGGGLIAGSVYDHNTNAALTGATVSNEDGYARSTAATPGDSTISDGFYVLYSPSGSKTFTATLSGYTPAVANGVPVADGQTGTQDFFLSAGHIVADPASLSAWLKPGGSTAKSFTLTNDGEATAVFTVTESVFTFADAIQDGGFELGTPNPHWSEYSSGGRDLITTHQPHTGSYGVRMGGTYNEITGLAQTLTIPQGTATLRFWLAMGIEIGSSPDADDWMQVYLDGNFLFTVNGSQYASYFSYTEVTVDVSAYADGGSHQLRFNSYNDSAMYSRFFVDDVSLIAVSPTIPWLSE